MTKMVGFFLLAIVSLSGVDLARDDEVKRERASVEFEVWSCSFPSPQIAFRFVGQDPSQGQPKIFEEEFESDSFKEALPDFLNYCDEELLNKGGTPLGVVAVGSMDQKGLLQFLRERYETINVEESTRPDSITLIPTRGLEQFDISLSYPTEFSNIDNEDDLKKLWVFYLIQELAENKFKKDVVTSAGTWMSRGNGSFLLPATKTIGRGVGKISLLESFLVSIKTLKESGFTESELADAKSHLIKHIKQFYAQDPNQNQLADYYASHLGASITPLNYVQFMEHSSQIIPGIAMDDVNQMLKISFKDDRREVTLRYPEGATVSLIDIKATLDQICSDHIKLDPDGGDTIVVTQKKDPFLLLPLADEEQNALRSLIQEVAEKGYLELMRDQSQIEKRGDKLRHIHPLRSLAAMFTDPYTKKCIAEIMDALFKRPPFVKDYSRRLNQEADKDNLLPYIQGFAVAVKANPEQVRIYVASRQWEALVKYLLKLDN
jgi:hypothetical protein